MTKSNLFSKRYRQLLQQEPGLITRARIRILTISILGFIVLYSILLTLYIIEERSLLLFRVSFMLGSMIFSLVLLAKFPWQISAHLFILTITSVVWSNALMFSNGVNATTVQYTILSLSFGYYLLGPKWGATYASLNILPIIGITIVENYAGANISLPTRQFSNNAYALVLIFNYLLLMLVHYTFFKTYRSVQLQETLLKENLTQAVLTAQELAQAKTNFLSTMSHELRTPLHAVIGMANLLRTGGPERDRQENLDVLRFSAESLMSTVNDILDFNKIEMEDLSLEKNLFSPAVLLNNIYGALSPTASQKGIELIYHQDPQLKGMMLIGDDTRLSQILFNLIGNAIKFTPKGQVTLKVSCQQALRETIRLNFQIIDTGIGIPAENLSTIFDPFIQVSARTSSRSRGTGLGLTIAHKLVKIKGGTLKLHSQPGKGTTFSFSISYQVAPTAVDQQAGQHAQKELKGLRVLIAEDEKVNVMVLKKILERWQIYPDVRENGALALQAITENQYDVILMDINMPIMDGFEAARLIRALPDQKKASIPIIAITASVGAAAQQVLDNTEIDDCLLKPFKIEHLREKLEQLDSFPQHQTKL